MMRRLGRVSVSVRHFVMQKLRDVYVLVLTSTIRVEVGEAAVELKQLVDEPGRPLGWRRVLDSWLRSGWKSWGASGRRW